MVAAETYAVAVNFVPAYRIPADMVGKSKIGLDHTGATGSDVEQNVEGKVLDGAEVVQIEKEDRVAG